MTAKTTSLARDSLVAPGTAYKTMVSKPNRSLSASGATAAPWSAKGVTRVLTAQMAGKWGGLHSTWRPACRRRENTGLVPRAPPTGTSTPSWHKQSAAGMGGPHRKTAKLLALPPPPPPATKSTIGHGLQQGPRPGPTGAPPPPPSATGNAPPAW